MSATPVSTDSSSSRGSEHRFALMAPEGLRPHEEYELQRLESLRQWIRTDGHLYHPVVVDQHSFVILDGHHRVQVLREMGCSLVPVYLVNYLGGHIQVFPRRKDVAVDKERIIQRGLQGVPFPPRTSRHVFDPPLAPHPVRVDTLLHRVP